ncbi:MAG: hypothetical protein GY847_11300 [Proteobacteria bacterium]|nr:hypothetical protein [Pseudomonadota bacterium]
MNDDPFDRKSMIREIEEQERLIVSLEKQKDNAQARLLTLRAKLVEFDSSNRWPKEKTKSKT